MILANARCILCDAELHASCLGGALVQLEVHTAADGEFALSSGHLVRVIGNKEPLAYGCAREADVSAARLMRFRDHKVHCSKVLTPEPDTKPTQRTRVFNRDR